MLEKTYNGKVYSLSMGYPSKLQADKTATYWREHGIKARVENDGKWWLVRICREDFENTKFDTKQLKGRADAAATKKRRK